MPILNLSIANTTDDGFGKVTGTVNNHINQGVFTTATSVKVGYAQNGSNIIRNSAFLRFTGITIPADASIQSAYIVLYAKHSQFQSFPITITAKDIQNPVNPTTANQLVPPYGGATDKITGVATLNIPNAGTFVQFNIDVKAIVENLVNSYTYNNGAMLFRVNKPTSQYGTPSSYYKVYIHNKGTVAVGEEPLLQIIYNTSSTVTTLTNQDLFANTAGYVVDPSQFAAITYGGPTSAPRKTGVSINFLISNIAQNSTINSATLTVYGGQYVGTTGAINIKAKNLQTPPTPTQGSHIISPSNAITGTNNLYFTNILQYNSKKGSYLPATVDITNLVQALVNSYDYSSNKNMLFFLNQTNINNGSYMYNENWGDIRSPTLSIDYAEPPAATLQAKTVYRFK